MKYIIIKASWNKDEEALVFPNGVRHHPVAMSVGFMDSYEVISAGFCDKNFNAYGESTSMNRKSRPVEDTAILQRIFVKEFY